MGTEIVGLIIFILLALAVSVASGVVIKSLPMAIALSALMVVLSVQVMNYLFVGQFQLLSVQQFAFIGGVPAIITLVVGLAERNKRALN